MTTLSGFYSFKKKLKKIATVQYPNATLAALREAVLMTKRASMLNTPVDTGNLRSSTYTKVWKQSKDKFSGLVYNTAKYAPYVHEILTNRHPVGEAKFLEKAMFETAPKFARILRRRLRAARGGAFFKGSSYSKADWKGSIRR